MRKLVVMMGLAEGYVQQIRQVAPDWEIVVSKDSAVYLPHLPEAEVLIGWNKDAARLCLTAGAALRWVHNWGAGVNQYPFEEFAQKGLMLTNSSGVHAYPISETILAMMLAFTRKIDTYVRNQLQKKWHHSHNVLELHGKTVGIVGVGAIGLETARIAKAFGMRVIGLRRCGEPAEYVDTMYGTAGLRDLLAQSDYVVNTLPLTSETHHLFGKEEFAMMKPSSFYVNIGRGQTTDTEALLQALQSKQIAGAGLDVFEQEPLPEDSPLWELDNVILTPHTSGSTEHYNDRAMDIFLPNFKAYVIGEEPVLNRVQLDRQY